MNDQTIEYIAYLGLDMLKRSILLVLYQQHLKAGPNGPLASPALSLKNIREQLGLKHVGVSNDLVRGVLNYLMHMKYVENSTIFSNRWQITDSGIAFIERQVFPKTLPSDHR